MDPSILTRVPSTDIMNMTPNRIMRILLHSGVNADSITAWHRYLKDIPDHVLLYWIQSIRCDTALDEATVPSPSNSTTVGPYTPVHSGFVYQNNNAPPVESVDDNVVNTEASQSIHCPARGCTHKWKCSKTWFVKHLKEKHIDQYRDWFDIVEPWRCLRCERRFSNEADLIDHMWETHMNQASSPVPGGK
ncbi:hypothetical protein EK21DRAFT_83515 [Setomelanomma holmii]|uniref:C2H2-type domain-containing protein n=1 Tax=Setomelanomma holmii TaxID=210430 RepID=A0A9P4LSL6_9PLEO|nr:hypothetical protein EK21DRAFT_83515 [Setomelanomma holmii]